MTDKYNCLTVVLEHDVRSDDAEILISAIQQLRGVLSVQGNISDSTSFMAQERARNDLGSKIWEVIHPKNK